MEEKHFFVAWAISSNSWAAARIQNDAISEARTGEYTCTFILYLCTATPTGEPDVDNTTLIGYGSVSGKKLTVDPSIEELLFPSGSRWPDKLFTTIGSAIYAKHNLPSPSDEYLN